MVRGAAAAFSTPPAARGRLARLIVVGTIPVVVVGAAVRRLRSKRTLRTPAVAAATLAVGAVGCSWPSASARGRATSDELTAGPTRC